MSHHIRPQSDASKAAAGPASTAPGLQVLPVSLTENSLNQLIEIIQQAWQIREGGGTPTPLLLHDENLEPAAAEELEARTRSASGRRALSDVILATSGSTGSQPNLVGLSWDALIFSAQSTIDHFGEPGRWFLSLPTHHVAGLLVVIRALLGGSLPVLATDLPAAIRSFAAEGQARTAPLFGAIVPTQLHRWATAPELSQMDALLVGGAHLNDSLRQLTLSLPLVTTYGMTETCGGCVYDGVPLPQVALRISDSRIEISGPQLMDGYIDQPSPLSVDTGETRWLRTGDLGRWDGKRLTILGRADDMLISGGENISATTVEDAALRFLPPASSAHVWGQPHPEWGQVVYLAVTGHIDASELGPQLRTELRKLLGPAAAPRLIAVLPSFPELKNGKIDRRTLRDTVERKLGSSAVWEHSPASSSDER